MDTTISPEQIQPEITQNSRFSFLKSAKVWPIIVLLALLIPTGAYFLGKSQSNKQTSTVQTSPTPTPDPTANWRTYLSTEYQFKYPNNYYIYEDKTQPKIVHISPDALDKYAKGGTPRIDISLSINIMPSNQKSESVKVGNLEGIIFKNTGCQYTCDLVFVNANKSKYEISSVKPFGKEIPFSIFQQILSTFKFTDPTANWKPYMGATGNFTIKYPSSWKNLVSGNITTGTETTAFGPNITNVSEDNATKFWIQLQSTNNQNTPIKTALDYKNSIMQGQSGNPNGSGLQTNMTTIDGTAAYRVSYTDAGNNLVHVIFSKG